jgi:uncharacterized protein
MKDNKGILDRIKKIVTEKEPSAKIYLYGSRVRGNAKPDSDWDILILLNIEKITPDIEKGISWSLYDLELDTGEVISPMIYSSKEWSARYSVTPFYHNIMKEGQLI